MLIRYVESADKSEWYRHDRHLPECGFETFFSGEGAYHDGVYEICKSVWKA